MFKSIAEALRKAGYSSDLPPGDPRARLEQMMAQAIAHGGGLEDPSCDDFIKRLLDAKEWELIWVLCEQIRRSAIRQLFGVVLYNIKKQNKELFADEAPPKRQTQAPPPPPAAGARAPATKSRSGPPATPAPPPPQPSTAVGEAFFKGEERRARRCRYDILMLNNRPIGDADRVEIAQFKHLRGREKKFAELIMARVPPNYHLPIRECIKPEEADRLWELANQDDDIAA